MKALDTIYIYENSNSDTFTINATTNLADKKHEVAYIRKDCLLEWAEAQKKHYLEREEYDFGWNNALEALTDKLESM